MTYRYNCRREGKCFLRHEMPDWAMLEGCFEEEPRVSAADIDGQVYQNKRHLWLEKKTVRGNWFYPVLTGPQVRSAKNLVRRGDTFIAIWCRKPDGSDISAMRVLHPDGDTGLIMASLKTFRQVARSWWLSVYNGSMD